MTRIIRLTESDLTRIVKRVIKEQTTMPPVTVTAQRTQKLEDTKFTPKLFNKITAAKGLEVTASIKSTDPTTRKLDIKPIMWKITPSIVKIKDNNAKVVRVPGMLNLNIELEGIKDTFVIVKLNCRTGQIDYVNKLIQNTYDKSLSLVAANMPPFTTTVNGFAQTFNNSGWKYVGAIKEVGDMYCKSV